MATNIKGLTIKIGADTTQLSAALRSVDKELKTTQDDLRAVQRSLKFNPGNTELLAQQQRGYQKAVEETSSRLNTLQEAQKQMEQGGITDEQQAEYDALRREIIKTENQLERFKQQSILAGNTGASAAAKVAYAFNQASVKLETMSGKFTAAGNSMRGVSRIATAGLAGLGAAAYKAGESADDIVTLSKQTGIATDELQKFAYASELLDVPMETLARSTQRLKRSMYSAQQGSKQAATAFESIGVAVTDANGNLRDSSAVFDEIINALGKMENETERDALAMTIFGKSAAQLNPLIEAGSSALADLGKEAESMGLILDQDALDAANSFKDGLDKLRNTVVMSIVKIGTSFTKIMPPLDSIRDKVAIFADRISRANPETVKLVAKLLALTAVLSPLLRILGGVTGALAVMSKGISNVALKAATAGGNIGVLSSSLASIAGPLAVGVAGAIALHAAFQKMGLIDNTAKEFHDSITSMKRDIDTLTEAYQVEKRARDEALASIGGEAEANQRTIDKLLELDGIKDKTNAQLAQEKQLIDQLNESIPELNLAYDEETGKINMTAEALRDRAKAYEEEAKARALSEGIAEATKRQLDAETKLTEARGKQAEAQAKYNAEVEKLNKIQRVESGEYQAQADKVGEYTIALGEANDAVSSLESTIKSSSSDVQAYTNQLLASSNETAKAVLDVASQVGIAYGDIPETMFSSIEKGLYNLPTNKADLQRFIDIENLRNQAKVAGVNIDDDMVKGIASGQIDLQKAAQGLGLYFDAGTNTWKSRQAESGAQAAQNLANGAASKQEVLRGTGSLLGRILNAGQREGLTSSADGPRSALQSVITRAINKADTSGAKSIGRNIDEGIASGMRDNVLSAIRAGQSVVNAVLTEVKNQAKIKSPSALFRDEVGKNIGLGIAVGINDSTAAIVKSAHDQMTSLQDAYSGIDLSVSAASIQGSMNYAAGGQAQPDNQAVVAQAIMTGLAQIGSMFFSALPQDIVLNIDGREFVKATWNDFVQEASRRGDMFTMNSNTMEALHE